MFNGLKKRIQKYKFTFTANNLFAYWQLHSSLMVAQDALDGAELRRGRASWPAHCGLGLRAVNDAALLETGLYQLLKLHFRSHPHYLEILELFHDVNIAD
jgi:farnesyl diphosphate synthase